MREKSDTRMFFPRWGSLLLPTAFVLLFLLIAILKAMWDEISHEQLRWIAISSVVAWPLVLIGARYLGRVWVAADGIRCVGRKVVLWSEITDVSRFDTPLLAGVHVRSTHKLTVIVHHSIMANPQFRQSIAAVARDSMLYALLLPADTPSQHSGDAS